MRGGVLGCLRSPSAAPPLRENQHRRRPVDPLLQPLDPQEAPGHPCALCRPLHSATSTWSAPVHDRSYLPQRHRPAPPAQDLIEPSGRLLRELHLDRGRIAVQRRPGRGDENALLIARRRRRAYARAARAPLIHAPRERALRRAPAVRPGEPQRPRGAQSPAILLPDQAPRVPRRADRCACRPRTARPRRTAAPTSAEPPLANAPPFGASSPFAYSPRAPPHPAAPPQTER